MLKNKKKGSILVFSLFILMISLIIGLGIISSASITRKSSLSTSDSIYAFQIADSGIEFAFDLIKNYTKDNTVDPVSGRFLDVRVKDIFKISGGLDDPKCIETGTKEGMIEGPLGSYTVSLYGGNSDTFINCNAAAKKVEQIHRIKATGTYNGTSRTVEAVNVDLTEMFGPPPTP